MLGHNTSKKSTKINLYSVVDFNSLACVLQRLWNRQVRRWNGSSKWRGGGVRRLSGTWHGSRGVQRWSSNGGRGSRRWLRASTGGYQRRGYNRARNGDQQEYGDATTEDQEYGETWGDEAPAEGGSEKVWDGGGGGGRGGDGDGAHGSRSRCSRRSAARRTPVDVRRVAVLGDLRTSVGVFSEAAEEREDPEQRRPGRRPILAKWYSPDGGMESHFTGVQLDDWRRLIWAVTDAKSTDDPPDFAVISISAEAVVSVGEGLYDAEEWWVDEKRDREHASERIVSGLCLFLESMRLMLPHLCPLILGVVPPNSWQCDVVNAVRSLSVALRETARKYDAFFVDVEAVVCRHFSGATELTDAKSRSRQRDAWAAHIARQALHQEEPLTESRLREILAEHEVRLRRDISKELRDELRREISKELRDDLRREISKELRDELRRDLRSSQEPEEVLVEVSNVKKPESVSTDNFTKATSCDKTRVAKKVLEPRAPNGKTVAATSETTVLEAEVDVPWMSGWVPGQPPSASINDLQDHLYDAYDEPKGFFNGEAFAAIRAEIMKIITL